MSANKEEPNNFEDQPDNAEAAVQTPAEETATVHDAVKQAINQQGIAKIDLASCPCGAVNVNLMLELDKSNKIGRATCGSCGTWGVDFLAPKSQNQELLGKAAAKAWNEAPRAA